jgi:hypothetical protein
MRLYKKSQAAMEFLMSYGWALLVVLLVIAALAYFGMLNPERFLPDKVNLGSGLTVMSSTLDERFLTLVVNNGLGKTLNNFVINATLCGTDGVMSGTYTFAEGESKKIIIPCGKQLKNSKFKSDLITTYNTMTYSESVSHISKGDLKMSVNDGCKSEGLVGGYTFDKDMNDCSGNGKHAICTGSVCPSQEKGAIGNSYYFDGTDDYLRIGSLTTGSDLTYSFWVKVSSIPANMVTIWDDNSAGGGDSWITLTTGNAVETQRAGDGFGVLTTGSVISMGTWTHIALVTKSSGTTKKIFVNGILVASDSVSITSRTGVSYVSIGRGFDGAGFPTAQIMRGNIDEAYIFTRSLSDDEVKGLYLAGR